MFIKSVSVVTVVFFLFFACFNSSVVASTISVSDIPTTIDENDEVEVSLFFSCAGCNDSYFRGVFYPSGTNYFGYTQNNNGDWVGAETDRSKYFKIAKSDLIDASWSGKVKVKADTSDPAFSGPGEYFLKVGRYTSASDSSADWSNELVIKITGSTPTPSASPTPISTPTNTPASTPISIKTPTPTPHRTLTPAPEVLGVASSSSSTSGDYLPKMSTTLPTPIAKSNSGPPFVAGLFIFSGTSLVGLASYLAFKKQKGESSDTINE